MRSKFDYNNALMENNAIGTCACRKDRYNPTRHSSLSFYQIFRES